MAGSAPLLVAVAPALLLMSAAAAKFNHANNPDTNYINAPLLKEKRDYYFQKGCFNG
jgi:hypothetical protein